MRKIRITENRLRRIIRKLIIESNKYETKEEDDENLLLEPDVNEDREKDQPQYDKQKEVDSDAIDELNIVASGGVGGYMGRAFDPDPEKPKG